MRNSTSAVGELPVREQRRGRRQVRGDRAAQVLDVVRLQRRYRHDGEKRVARGRAPPDTAAAARAGARGRSCSRRRWRRARSGPARASTSSSSLVHFSASSTMHHHVRLLQRCGRGAVHGLVERAARLVVQAGGVEEGDLHVRGGVDAEDAMAGRLRARRDDTRAFAPTSAFSSVDLPTFGRPTSAAKPLRCVRGSGLVTGRVPRPQPAPTRSSMRAAASCSARRRLEPLPRVARFRAGTSQLTRETLGVVFAGYAYRPRSAAAPDCATADTPAGASWHP